MKLIICPKCNSMIDLDDIEVRIPQPDDVVGCGLAEDDFGPCYKCLGENDPDECSDIRRYLGLTETLCKELPGKGELINDTE